MTEKDVAIAPTASARIAPRAFRSRLGLVVSLTLCWIIAAAVLAGMVSTCPVPAWDARVYWKAIQSLQHGTDPYLSGLAAQQVFHDSAHKATDHPPFTYVYSPMTLPLLRSLGGLPGWLLALLYGLAIVAGFLLVLWVGFEMATEGERPWLALMLPFAGFFPGMLNDDVILSCNVVYLFYGLIFAAAFFGWKRGRWFWYYLATLAASTCKAPLLTLLAFPILVGRRQWVPAGITGATGLALFFVQSWLWPELFREYMLAVRLQFDWNHDFGFGPAGVLGQTLWEMGKPYSPATTALYLIFASALGSILLFLAHRVLQGRLSREIWIPTALVGTILLNPRIKEYDLGAITIPMLLIAWRMMRYVVNLASGKGAGEASQSSSPWPNPALVLAGSGWFVAFNIIAAEVEWKPTALGVMLGVFTLGVCSLYCLPHEARSIAMSPAPSREYPQEVASYCALPQ